MVSWGAVSPYLEPRTPSSLFFPMDPYAPIASRLGLWTHVRKASRTYHRAEVAPRRRAWLSKPLSPNSDTTEIQRCVIASFRFAESMGFKGDFRQWEHLLLIGD